uniref:Transmembrane protein n=1 Tax=Davidia involucrata TaxID=16924 RepID=A0A5B7ATE1_DAVIN
MREEGKGEVLMDHIPPRDRDSAVDLESGETTGYEMGSIDPVLGAKLAKTFFAKVCSGLMSVDGLVKGEKGVNLGGNVSNGSKVCQENVKLFIDKNMEGEEAANIAEKKPGNQKHKKTSAKKPPKPPRPPRGPSLDAADQKLIKEISELVRIKRARIERMKALKKMKAAKASSSNGNLFSMLFTILFCLVIIFQGMSSRRSSPIGFQGSTDSTRGTGGGFVSLRYHWNPSANDANIPGSWSPNLLEQVSGSDPEDKVSKLWDEMEYNRE